MSTRMVAVGTCIKCAKKTTYLEIVKNISFSNVFFSVVRQEVKIGKVIIHDQFEPETFDNDIALVCKFF